MGHILFLNTFYYTFPQFDLMWRLAQIPACLCMRERKQESCTSHCTLIVKCAHVCLGACYSACVLVTTASVSKCLEGLLRT